MSLQTWAEGHADARPHINDIYQLELIINCLEFTFKIQLQNKYYMPISNERIIPLCFAVLDC